VLGFLPLVVFGAMSGRLADNSDAWAALVGVAVAVADAWFARPRRPARLTTIVQAVLLAVVAIVGFTGGPTVDRWLFDWGSGVVAVATGLVIVAALPVFAFTEQYARVTTPRVYWSAPTFKSINRVLSAAWGAALAGIGLSSILLACIQTRAASVDGAHLADLLLNWIAPTAVLWFMIRFTAEYPRRVIGADTPADADLAHAGRANKGVNR
jgi:hypothetical protein